MKHWLFIARFFCLAAAAAELQPVYRMKEPPGAWRTARDFGFSAHAAEGAAFRAVLSEHWIPGLVPVFLVERAGRAELRRRPPRGQENITEPIFFAVPAEEEKETPLIAGHWRCEALRADGTKTYPDFELAIDGTNVAARFDQRTEYRFAFITGGTFQSMQLKMAIEYISEKYEMTGVWNNGRLSGSWKHLTGTESGQWFAERDLSEFKMVEPGLLKPLFAWRHEDGRVQYGVGEAGPGSGWKREERPLCRVWQVK